MSVQREVFSWVSFHTLGADSQVLERPCCIYPDV